MEQKARFRSLVFLCMLILSGLVGIQLFLIRNTYRLNLANYHNAIKNGYIKVQSDTDYRKIELQYVYNLIDFAGRLESGKIDETLFKDLLRQKDQEVSARLDSLVAIRAVKRLVLKNVRQHAAYTSIIIKGAGLTINPVKISQTPLSITRPYGKNARIIFLGESTGTTAQTGTQGELHIVYSFSRNLEITALPPVIVRQLALVGGLSLVLLIAVVVLLYRALMAAHRQRKIAELREDLVNNITHELKTPLSSMAIAFKTLRHIKTDAITPQQDSLIDAIERQHYKLNQTVERVLDSAMHQQPKTMALDIVALLNDYTAGIFLKKHPFSFSFQPCTCYVTGTSGLIESILDNLLENAQKYTDPGSPIHLVGKSSERHYCIDVIDSGKGIAKEFHKHLFEKFYRVPEKDLHSVKGLGLGLYLIRQAANSIGGDVRLTSSSSEGSSFTLILPLA